MGLNMLVMIGRLGPHGMAGELVARPFGESLVALSHYCLFWSEAFL